TDGLPAGDIMAEFKNINGVYRLKEMFFETALNKDNVIYTLKDHDHAGYPSLYIAFMEAHDPTEYKFAVHALGGWEHWKQLRECSWFQPYYDRWKEELEVKIRSQALAKIITTANGNTKDSFGAQKYVTERQWDAPRATKGRPAKE